MRAESLRRGDGGVAQARARHAHKTNRGGGHDSSAPALIQAKRGTHGSDIGGDGVLKGAGHGPDVCVQAVNFAYAAAAFAAVGTDAMVFRICDAIW
jgi:hypothetical protein